MKQFKISENNKTENNANLRGKLSWN